MNSIDPAIAILAVAGLLALILVATYHMGKAEGSYQAEREARRELAAATAAVEKHWKVTKGALDGYYQRLLSWRSSMLTFHAQLVKTAAAVGATENPPAIPDPPTPPPSRLVH